MLLFFIFGLPDDVTFPNRFDTRYERAIPSFPSSPIVTGNILAAWAWRENQSFRPAISVSFFFLFLPSLPWRFPDKRITRMARYAESLVRAKAKSDDLSLSPKATSNFFLFTFYTYKESLSLSPTRTLIFTLFLSPEPACRRSKILPNFAKDMFSMKSCIRSLSLSFVIYKRYWWNKDFLILAPWKVILCTFKSVIPDWIY